MTGTDLTTTARGELALTLAEHETIIERAGADALRSFVVVGEELDAIRDDRSYLATHKTFEAYTRERWGFSASRARHSSQHRRPLHL